MNEQQLIEQERQLMAEAYFHIESINGHSAALEQVRSSLNQIRSKIKEAQDDNNSTKQ